MLLLVGAGLSVPAAAFQLAYDDWSGPDKTQHMLGSIYAGASATQFVRTYMDDPANAILWGAVIGQLPGLMRETVQGFQSSGFSYKDHAFNAAGAVLGALLQQNNWMHIVTLGSDAMGTGVVIVLRWRFIHAHGKNVIQRLMKSNGSHAHVLAGRQVPLLVSGFQFEGSEQRQCISGRDRRREYQKRQD